MHCQAFFTSRKEGLTFVFLLPRRGKLSVRPSQKSDPVEYLVLDLDPQIKRTVIYRRRIGQELEVYEMRAA